MVTVSTIISVALIVIFVISAAVIFGILFPSIGTRVGCSAAQRLHIEEINSTVKDAKTYDTTYNLKFRVEDCVECMWYDDPNLQLKIRWTEMSATDEAVIIGVSVPWNIGDNADGDDYTCSLTPTDNLKGDTTCVFEVTYNAVNKLQC